MSLSYQRLQPVLVKDPVSILDNVREYAVLKSGSQTTFKQFTTTSISSSSIQFSCPPPSGGIIVDRKIWFLLPVRLTITGTVSAGEALLNPNTDAPRAYPISSSIDTMQMSINNQSVSINMADIVQAMLRYNTNEELAMRDFSLTPSYQDQSQAYSQLFGSNRNPLGFYGDAVDKSMMPRGGFPFTIISNPVSEGGGSITAVVDMVVCEPLFLSPLYWGYENESGFYNVNTMDFNFTFLGNAGFRMWSHDAVSVPGTSITSISVQFNNFSGPAFSYTNDSQPYLLFKYITPLETEKLPFNQPITYPYFDIQRFPTDKSGAVSAGAQWANFSSNNIQLNSIPRRMYIYVRERNADLYSTAHNPDTYFSIENISIQFQNKNGLLASANKRQLYEMSVKNHCNMSWEQWSGGPVYATGSFGSTIGTVGSILCIEFATDIGLSDIEAPGKLGQYMLQIQGTATNISNRNIDPTLYIVVVSEGTFTIEGLGKASTNIGVITSQDILDAQAQPWVDYYDVQQVNGGNFLSGLKSFGNKLWKYARDNKIVSKGLKAIPHPYAQVAAPVAEALGLGSGVMVGGKRMNRKSLRDRL
jgi:hypothetical protein